MPSTATASLSSAEDVRRRILQIMYDKRLVNVEPPGNSHAWAQILGIDEAMASINLQYLVETGKIDGVPIFMPGSTLLQTVIVQRLTASGIDFVERDRRQDSRPARDEQLGMLGWLKGPKKRRQ